MKSFFLILLSLLFFGSIPQTSAQTPSSTSAPETISFTFEKCTDANTLRGARAYGMKSILVVHFEKDMFGKEDEPAKNEVEKLRDQKIILFLKEFAESPISRGTIVLADRNLMTVMTTGNPAQVEALSHVLLERLEKQLGVKFSYVSKRPAPANLTAGTFLYKTFYFTYTLIS